MTHSTFYRGISVRPDLAEATVAQLTTSGFTGKEGTWGFKVPDIADIRERSAALFADADLQRGDMFQSASFDGTFASGTAEGAEYYALHRGQPVDETPLVVVFRVPTSDVYVDARDFLYTAFQMWDYRGVHGKAKQIAILESLFGAAITLYFDAAAVTKDQSRRVALCALAAFDAAVVSAHLENRRVILGRYKTRFASAFCVKCPVAPSEIVKVYVPQHDLPTEPAISLNHFLALGVG